MSHLIIFPLFTVKALIKSKFAFVNFNENLSITFIAPRDSLSLFVSPDSNSLDDHCSGDKENENILIDHFLKEWKFHSDDLNLSCLATAFSPQLKPLLPLIYELINK
jgi:hypothetical protein